MRPTPLTLAARKHGIPVTTLRDRVKLKGMTLEEAIAEGVRIDKLSPVTKKAIDVGVNVKTVRNRLSMGYDEQQAFEPISAKQQRATLIRTVGLEPVIESEWHRPLATVVRLLVRDGCTIGDVADVLDINPITLKKYFNAASIKWPRKSKGLGVQLLQSTKVDGKYQLGKHIGSPNELAATLGISRSQVYYRLEELTRSLLQARYRPFERSVCSSCQGVGHMAMQARVGGFSLTPSECTPCRGFGTLPNEP